MSTLAGLALLALMAVLALRADRRLAPGRPTLPMTFAPDGSVLMRAPRRVALGVLPALAAAGFAALSLVAPGSPVALVPVLSLLAGQVFYHRLAGRAA